MPAILRKTQVRLAAVIGALIWSALLAGSPASAAAAPQKTTVAYRTVDGRPILADVYRPAGTDLRPVIVWLHGGALMNGSRETINPRVRAIAEERGYALVSVDYRLAPETKLPAIVGDVEAAFAWLGGDGARRFHLDTKRVVVVGGSAGGYLALVTGYRVRPKPTAIVSLYGYGRLNADWYTQPNHFPEYNTKRFTEADADAQTDGAPVSDGARRKGDGQLIYLYYRQTGSWLQHVIGPAPQGLSAATVPYEPAANVRRDYPPTVLVHGREDHDVPYEESVNMAAQLERHGVPYLLESVDKAGHGLEGGDKDQIDKAYATIREFIMRYLEPAP